MEALSGGPRFSLIQHVPFEGPGTIESAARGAGVELQIRRMWMGESLPTGGEIDGLVVMGGPMGVEDGAEHPHLDDEVRLLEECADRRVPILGVCLGAQLLARALGAAVTTGPVEEVGIGAIELTEGGRADPVLGPAGPRLAVLHWHQDTFAIPDGATHLATSERYPHQAFRYGECCYGLQFHVELDRELAGSLHPHLPPGVEVQEPDVLRVERSGVGILERFFQRASGAQAETVADAPR
jgi:GMP synthase (glutamine-hydrolysing)